MQRIVQVTGACMYAGQCRLQPCTTYQQLVEQVLNFVAETGKLNVEATVVVVKSGAFWSPSIR